MLYPSRSFVVKIINAIIFIVIALVLVSQLPSRAIP